MNQPHYRRPKPTKKPPHIVVSYHATDRYREHYPEAELADIRRAMATARAIDRSLVNALCGRGKSAGSTSRYLCAEDCRGIFVIDNGRLVTYLRLGETQQEILRGEGAPT